MLLSLLTLSLSLTNPAFKIGDISQDICQSEQVIKAIGAKGSCRMVLAPKKSERHGECSGVFAGSLPCNILYGSDKSGSGLNIKCGTNPEDPSVDQSMEAEISSFNVAAFLSLENGKMTVINDPSLYTMVNNKLIEITIAESENKTEAVIAINAEGGKQFLTNVSCR